MFYNIYQILEILTHLKMNINEFYFDFMSSFNCWS